ncbi:MAG: hypothetical protein ACI89J_003484 [Hyphomicrobiaceae bacterium]|jgi:hypothetical protein
MQVPSVAVSPDGGYGRQGFCNLIFVATRSIPIVRTCRPPCAISWAPKTCSTRARVLLLLLLVFCWCSVREFSYLIESYWIPFWGEQCFIIDAGEKASTNDQASI